MADSMAAVMRRVKNYFECEKIEGTFTITGGMLEPMPEAPYVAISGSRWHRGIFPAGQFPDDRPDESFDGVVWGLDPPPDFLAICEQIDDYASKRAAGAPQSESFGDYSYSMGSASGGLPGAMEAFDSLLAPYRRMFTEVDV